MKSFHVYDTKDEFKAIERYANGWNPDTMQPMERNIPLYLKLKNELIQTSCSQNILTDRKGAILYAEELYDQIVIFDESFHVGDNVISYLLSGDVAGVIQEIKVYFSTVSWELEWDMKIKTKEGKVITIQKQNSPHLLKEKGYA